MHFSEREVLIEEGKAFRKAKGPIITMNIPPRALNIYLNRGWNLVSDSGGGSWGVRRYTISITRADLIRRLANG